MLKSIEAIVDQDGHVKLLEKIKIKGTHRAVVTILDEVIEEKNVAAFLSEKALEDWSRPEEEDAWKHLSWHVIANLDCFVANAPRNDVL